MSFDFGKYIGALSYTKEDVYQDNDTYIPFLVDRAFSYFPDTILYSYDIAMYSNQLDKRMNYLFWMMSIPKRKRYSKWDKKKTGKDIEAVSKIYNVSKKKAEEYVKCLTDEQLKEIMQEYDNIQ